MTAGSKFKQAIRNNKPLQLLGVLNPYMALQLQKSGFDAAYLSGGGLACFTHGIPDVGVLTMTDFTDAIYKITRVCNTPLLADCDTGFGNPEKCVQEYIKAGAAGLHIEDQTEDKRCGHLDGKSTVSTAEMVERIKQAVKGKTSGEIKDDDFMIMARTDALATEGFNAAVSRIVSYVEAGADAVFAEAMPDLEQYKRIREAIGPDVPLLANVTEYGKIDLFTSHELAEQGVDIVLYPVSLARGMHGVLENWLTEIKDTGTTQGMVDRGELRPRSEYNAVIDYDPDRDDRETVLAKLKV
ncbi:MAG: methylisocitrate lyase [Magnetococcales bacterium]|nr:methylisocitrate lyase [Magnetococcales bacterium]